MLAEDWRMWCTHFSNTLKDSNLVDTANQIWFPIDELLSIDRGDYDISWTHKCHSRRNTLVSICVSLDMDWGHQVCKCQRLLCKHGKCKSFHPVPVERHITVGLRQACTLSPEQYGKHFADDIWKCVLWFFLQFYRRLFLAYVTWDTRDNNAFSHWLRSFSYDPSMMTSSNGNIFRVTGHLCGEFTGHRWIPCTKASDAELWRFLWSAPE